jgi:hypothetical protein
MKEIDMRAHYDFSPFYGDLDAPAIRAARVLATGTTATNLVWMR